MVLGREGTGVGGGSLVWVSGKAAVHCTYACCEAHTENDPWVCGH